MTTRVAPYGVGGAAVIGLTAPQSRLERPAHHAMRRPRLPCAMTDHQPKALATVEPLDTKTLAARRAVILAKRRARRLAKPIYVNTDASWKDGVAGLAYVSGSLGNRAARVTCSGSIEAEYLALLMAMRDAEQAELPGPIDFRVDSTAVAHLAVGKTAELVELRHQVNALISKHREWRLALVERNRNSIANRMARRALTEEEGS